MDRRTFLGRFGMGAGALLLAPKIIASSIIKLGSPGPIDNDSWKWRSNEIFIRVINNNPTPTEVMLFGVMKDITGNFVPPGVKIMIAGGSIQDLNNMILANPVRILGVNLKVKNPAQFSNLVEIYNEHSSGRYEKMLWQPINWRSSLAQDPTQINAPSFELLLTPSIYMMNRINPGEQVDYIFTIASKSLQNQPSWSYLNNRES